jgi:hypothetical protein
LPIIDGIGATISVVLFAPTLTSFFLAVQSHILASYQASIGLRIKLRWVGMGRKADVTAKAPDDDRLGYAPEFAALQRLQDRGVLKRMRVVADAAVIVNTGSENRTLAGGLD